MNDDDLFIEIECAQIYKHGESIGGDHFCSKKFHDGQRIVSVLSDGLGSGVKANILSTMTAEMGIRFIGSDSDIVHSAEMMMDALPICQIRKISYATFTIIDNVSNSNLRIIEMDNPHCIFIRNQAEQELESKTVFSPRHAARKIRIMNITPLPEDRLIVFSDGVTQSGHGTPTYKLGWRRSGCLEYILEQLKQNPTISSQHLSRLIVEEARRKNIKREAHDDITAAVIYYRKPRKLLVTSGPPLSSSNDSNYALIFKNFKGRKVICGGTTSNIITRELKCKMSYDISTRDKDTPPISKAECADLITEGILTLTKCAQYLEEEHIPLNRTGATLLAKELRESDDITFLVGTKINEAHQDPTLPVDLEIRRNIIKRLQSVLKDKYLKKVTIQYI